MPLSSFGFTRTQDVVYKALLRLEAATGYAIARDTGLARANMYQALDALVARGLATTRGGRPATYRATPADDAVARLAAGAQHELETLAAELGSSDTGHLRRRSAGRPAVQVLEGRQALIDAAVHLAAAPRQEILAVVGPWAPALGDALAGARARTRTWRVVSLGEPAPEGATVREVAAPELTGYWGGLPIVLVCDRADAVCGIVGDEKTQGIRTSSPGLVPFLRHLLRRELASVAAPRVS